MKEASASDSDDAPSPASPQGPRCAAVVLRPAPAPTRQKDVSGKSYYSRWKIEVERRKEERKGNETERQTYLVCVQKHAEKANVCAL